jgi:hypothetical protein
MWISNPRDPDDRIYLDLIGARIQHPKPAAEDLVKRRRGEKETRRKGDWEKRRKGDAENLPYNIANVDF